MAMRSSDVSFLRREILPALLHVANVSPEAATAVERLIERLTPDDPGEEIPDGVQFNRWFHTVTGGREEPRNQADFDSWHITLEVDGQEVPYITGHWHEHGPHAGFVSLTLDHRFGIDTTDDEVRRWGYFLANAMAVSAGRTSHGPNSYIRNPHGRSGGGDPPPIIGDPLP